LLSSEPTVLVASSEFTLKSSPVRRTLEQRLIDDLKVGLTRNGFDGFRMEKDAGRIIVRGAQEAQSAARCCARVFGVAYAAPAMVLPASMNSVLEAIVRLAAKSLKPTQSFAIRAHRATPGPLSRHEIEIKGGSEVLRTLKPEAVKVDLTSPDVTFFVDLVGDHAYVYNERLTGPGGLPLSSQWRMLLILDSGPLSILAAYSMMRRGCLVEPLLPLSDTTHFFARDPQLRLARRLRDMVTRTSYRAFTLEFDRFLGGGRTNSFGYFNARQFVRSAGVKLATEKRYKGIVCSDVAGELAALNELVSNQVGPPMFQPLIGLTSEELIEMCRQVDLAEEELLSQLELENQISSSAALDLSEFLNQAEFEQLSL
jgi:thiamine biosynthesis protein ThiI